MLYIRWYTWNTIDNTRIYYNGAQNCVITLRRKTLGNFRYISVIVTRFCHKSKKRETDFLKNCSDLINKKRNKRCLRQLWTVVTSFNFRLNSFQYRYKKIHICIPRYIPFFLPLSLFFLIILQYNQNLSICLFCNERKIDGDELAKFYKAFNCWMNKIKNK